MNTLVNPLTVAPPAANYSHAVATPSGSRWLHTSGVVPTRPDGTVSNELVEQTVTVWVSIGEILAAAGFVYADIVSITTYVVAGHDLAPVMAVRDRVLDGHRPASTLVVVPSLARREWSIEIAVVAATDRPV